MIGSASPAHRRGVTSNQPRQPKGAPTGGRFAAASHGETGLKLGDSSPAFDPLTATATLHDALKRQREGGDWVDFDKTFRQVVPDVPEQVTEEAVVSAVAAHRAGDSMRVERIIDRLVDMQRDEARWRGDPSFVPLTAEVTHQGTGGPVVYTTVTGSKYDGEPRALREIAKDVRTDLKAAQRAGYLPDDLTFSVLTHQYAGGQAMNVEVRGMSDEDRLLDDPHAYSTPNATSAYANEIRQRVEAIAGAYGRQESDVQSDYWNVTYWCHVTLESELGAAQRAAGRDQRVTVLA